MSDECREEVKKDEVGAGCWALGAGAGRPWTAGQLGRKHAVWSSSRGRPCRWSVASGAPKCTLLLQLKAGTDFRLNVRLTKACAADVQQLCKGRVGAGGRLAGWLAEWFWDSVAAASAQAACESQAWHVASQQKRSWRLCCLHTQLHASIAPPDAAKACEGRVCGGVVLECLQVRLVWPGWLAGGFGGCSVPSSGWYGLCQSAFCPCAPRSLTPPSPTRQAHPC